jgi:PAS domain-containing protein
MSKCWCLRHRNAQSRAWGQYVRDPKTRLIWSDRDLSVLCRDGSELSVDFALTGLPLEGKPWSVVPIRSNGERKVAQLARLDAEERFRLAFEEDMAPMICTNLDDLIIAAHGAFCGIVGFSKEELIAASPSPLPIAMTSVSLKRPTGG